MRTPADIDPSGMSAGYLSGAVGGGRIVIDARYVRPKASGIGQYVQALIERVPALAPQTQFRIWTHPERPSPVTAANVTCLPVGAPADGLRTLLSPASLDPLGPNDVIHFPFSVLGRGLPCATVVTIHDLMWLEQPELVDRRPWLRRLRQGFYQQGMRWALAHATRIIAVSEASAARVRALAPESAERLRVTHNAASVGFVPPASADEAASKAAALIGSAAPYYLVVGKNEPYKAHDVALRAFARVARADDLLVLVQRTGSGAGLSKLAAELRIAAQLRWLPNLTAEQLVTLLQAARALLQPSIMEGFGLPALEAMACGCPVVASDTPALLEVLGGAGLHAAVGNSSAMGAAIEQLRDDALRERLRQRGLERAASFSWARTAAATLEVYRDAATAGPLTTNGKAR